MNLRRLLLLTQVPFWILLAASFALLAYTLQSRVHAVQQGDLARNEIMQIEQIMAHVVDMETGLRGYVIAGDPVFLQPYNNARTVVEGELNALRGSVARHPQPNMDQIGRLDRVAALIVRWQNEVATPELLARQRSAEQAASFVKSQKGRRIVDSIRQEVLVYTTQENTMLSAHEREAQHKLRLLWALIAIAGGATLLTSVLTILTGASAVARQLGTLTLAAQRLGDGQNTRPLTETGTAEIRQLSQAFNQLNGRLAEARHEADEYAAGLAARNQVMSQLGELSDTLQAARSLDEGAQILERALPVLLPGTRGVLLHHNASRNLLLPLVAWGGESSAVGAPDECWSLRRGEARNSEQTLFVPPCLGVGEHRYVCTPLYSHGETLGVLRVYDRQGASLDPAVQALVPGVTRQLALALSALRLQERLWQQSIRDPLTGLYNRRHLEDELATSLGRAATLDEPLSLLALDIDHFKRLNDTFGHDAGDAALVRVSAVLRDLTPTGALAARPGGEEFAVLLPGHDLAGAQALAERLRQDVAALNLSHAGIALGQITISVGVAACGPELQSPAALARAADEALYRAKRSGRNRVVAAGQPTEPVAVGA